MPNAKGSGIMLTYYLNTDTNMLTIYDGNRVKCTISNVTSDEQAKRLVEEIEYESMG